MSRGAHPARNPYGAGRQADQRRGDTLRQWRRIALERQLPDPGFPGGLRVPSTVILVCLVLIGIGAIGYSLRPPQRVIPRAVVDSQQDLVDETAHRLSVGAGRDAEQAESIAAQYAADPTHNATKLVNTAAAANRSYRTVAVWDPKTGQTVASAGEPVALNALPVNVLTMKSGSVGYVGADQRGRIVHIVRLNDGRLLGVATTVVVRALTLNPAAAQTIMFVLDPSTLIYSQGRQLPANDPVKAVIVRAVAGHGTHTRFGSPATINKTQLVPVVSRSHVDGTDYSVVSITYQARTSTTASTESAFLGVLLIAFALIGFGWTRLAFVRPLRRLLRDAKQVACGEFGGSSRISRLREARRIGTALRKLSTLRFTPHRRARPLTVGATAAVSLTAVLTVVWSVALFAVVRDASTVPPQIVADYKNHADDAASALGDTIDTGLVRLQNLAARNAGDAGDDQKVSHLLNRFLGDESRFRAAYLLRPDGGVSAEAGNRPLRRAPVSARTAGVVLDSRNTTVPLVLAHVPYGSGQLVAEFDVISLRSVLRRVRGDVHVVDGQMRSMLDTGGYIAFRSVGDTTVRTAAGGTRSPTGLARGRVIGGRIVAGSLVGTAGVGDTAGVGGTATTAAAATTSRTATAVASPAATLGWVVVVTRDVDQLALPLTQALHVAWLLAVLAITVSVLGWAWQYFMFVRPLRTLAETAEDVANDEHRNQITPEHFDEIGALAICLEVCRQIRNDGRDRVAGAVRLRGEGSDYTMVLPIVKISR